MQLISAKRAVFLGFVFINFPVLLLLLGPWFLLAGYSSVSLQIVGLVLIFSFLSAWAFWSVTVPYWRIWAMERVEDHNKLQQTAVRSGLVWPTGHFLERTEISSAKVRAKREALTRDRT